MKQFIALFGVALFILLAGCDTPISKPVCGDGICEETEKLICEKDCLKEKPLPPAEEPAAPQDPEPSYYETPEDTVYAPDSETATMPELPQTENPKTETPVIPIPLPPTITYNNLKTGDSIKDLNGINEYAGQKLRAEVIWVGKYTDESNAVTFNFFDASNRRVFKSNMFIGEDMNVIFKDNSGKNAVSDSIVVENITLGPNGSEDGAYATLRIIGVANVTRKPSGSGSGNNSSV